MNTVSDPSALPYETKREFFSTLALQNKWAMKLHRLSGQTQRGEKPPRYDGDKDQRWGDVTQHCLVEAAASRVLSDTLGLSPKDKEKFFKAALVHDAHKRPEIEAINAAKASLGADASPEDFDRINDIAYDQSKQFLLDNGVDPEVVRLTGTVAHTSVDQFVELDEHNTMRLRDDVPLLDMAMHWLDDATKQTQVVTIPERMDYLVENQDRYPYVEAGRAKWGGRTYFEAQREAALLVQDKLEAVAGIEHGTLPQVVNNGLAASILQFAQTTEL